MRHNLVQERIFECITYKCFVFHKTFSKAKIKFSQWRCRCQYADAEISKWPNKIDINSLILVVKTLRQKNTMLLFVLFNPEVGYSKVV